MTEILREGSGFRASCPKCRWTRHFTTVQNTFTKLAEHLQAVHRIRASFAPGTTEAIQTEMAKETRGAK